MEISVWMSVAFGLGITKHMDSSISSEIVFSFYFLRLMAPSGEVILVLLLAYMRVIVNMERVRD